MDEASIARIRRATGACLGAAVTALAVLAGCSGKPRSQAAGVGPSGGLVAALGVTVSVPPGAVDSWATLAVEPGTNVDQPRFMPVGPAVHVDAKGRSFSRPVAVTIPFDPRLLAASYEGATAADVYVLKRSDETGHVLRLTPTAVDMKRGLAQVQVQSFSTFQAAVPVPARFLYVTNFDDNTVSIYSVDNSTGRLRPRGYVYVGAGTNPDPIVVDPANAFLYEANFTANTIGAFALQANGFLSPLPGTPATGAGPVWIAIARATTNTFAYTANFMDSTISAFSINGGGSLGTLAGGRYVSKWLPEGIATHPTGISGQEFLYVPNYSTNSVTTFGVNPGGSLTTLQTIPSVTSDGPIGVTLEPSGGYAYVANWDAGTISTYAVQQSGAGVGTLSLRGVTARSPNIVNPIGITTDIFGSFVVSANYGSNNVSSFAIQQDGTLVLWDTKSAGSGPAALSGKVGSGGGANAIQKDPFGKYVYVVNQVTNEVMSFRLIPAGSPAAGTLIPGASFRTQTTPTELTVSSGSAGVVYTSKWAYVLTDNNYQELYSIRADGTLSATGMQYDMGSLPIGLAIDPTQRFAYAADHDNGTVSSFGIDSSTGALTKLGTLQLASGLTSIVSDPSARFVYGANSAARAIQVLKITATGALAMSTTLTAVGNGSAVSLCADPTGRFLYLADGGTPNTTPPYQVSVTAYRIDPASGSLILVGNVPTGGSGGLFDQNGLGVLPLAVDSTGRFAYVPNAGTNTLAEFAIDSTTGALTLVGTVTGNGLSSPAGIAANPIADVIYVTNASTVSTFAIDPGSGSLTLLATAPMDPGVLAIEVDLSGRYAYVTRSRGESVSVFTINPDGTLAPSATGRVNIGNNPLAVGIAGTIR